MKRLLLIALVAVTALPLAAQRRLTAREYIERYKHLAIADMADYGIPASVKMAQALLESDSGNSRLATLGNNHFGIKCKSTWRGETIAHDDDAPGECFRKYGSPEDSFRDHAEFLSTSPRYERLFTLDPMDYKAWARGLKECGYATNPQYPESLIRMIETHELYRLDTEDPLAPAAPATLAETLPEDPAADLRRKKVDIDNYAVSTHSLGSRPVYHNNGSEFIVAEQGDTYGTLAALTGIRANTLRKHNDASATTLPLDGEHVYLRRKAGRSLNGRVMHTAAEGETLRDVAQRYGIRMRALARLNRIPPTGPLSMGQQIRLM